MQHPHAASKWHVLGVLVAFLRLFPGNHFSDKHFYNLAELIQRPDAGGYFPRREQVARLGGPRGLFASFAAAINFWAYNSRIWQDCYNVPILTGMPHAGSKWHVSGVLVAFFALFVAVAIFWANISKIWQS